MVLWPGRIACSAPIRYPADTLSWTERSLPVARPEGEGSQAQETQASPTAIQWSVHPAKGHPFRTISIGVLAIGTGALAAWWFGSAMLGVLAAAALMLMLLPFLLKTTYTLGQADIEVRTILYHFARPLAPFRSFEMGADRLWLCTRSNRHLLDNYRGMLVLVGPHGERVRDALLERGLKAREADNTREEQP